MERALERTNARREMENRGEKAEEVPHGTDRNSHHRRRKVRRKDRIERLDRHSVKPLLHAKLPQMIQNEEEHKDTAHALQNIQPIACIVVTHQVLFAGEGDGNPIKRMEEQRQKDPKDLNDGQKRDLLQIEDSPCKRVFSCKRVGVGPNVFDQKRTQGQNSAKGMELTEVKSEP